ncbi:MAG: ATP-dependent DNA helicase RecG [Geminicoccaceae bacterium]
MGPPQSADTQAVPIGNRDRAETLAAAKQRANDLRPPLLHPLFVPVTTLPGVGPAVAAALGRLLGRPDPRTIELAAHLPSGGIDPTPRARLIDADEGEMVTLRVEIERHEEPPRGGRAPHRVHARLGDEPIELVFFGSRGPQLTARYPVGKPVLLHGRLARFGGRWQIAHPEPIEGDLSGLGAIPLYPLVQGLGQRRLRRLLDGLLGQIPELPEWLPDALLGQRGWPSWAAAARLVHRPEALAGLAPEAPARRRLACDELLASQLALGLMRRAREGRPGRALRGDKRLSAKLAAALPFDLTSCQRTAITEISADLAASGPMLRLLQGDVGSGKTLVATMALLQAIEAGTQAAVMAPTEVLARQHAITLERLLGPLDIGVVLLVGRDSAARRRAALADLAHGRADIAVGTHALLEEGVEFRDLGLVVIDEQHRFGVGQRLDLVVKGRGVDVLVMTATPIPRSLVLAAYGDLPVSQLRTKPPGRQPIVTRVVPSGRLDEVLEAIGRALDRGERIYWICPAIDGDETNPVAAVVDRHRLLTERFGTIVGLAHGRLPGPAKAAALEAFAAGDTRLLVATTVVEVGVDVTEASIMVIEHAERYGLAQLHQLRGRVGRGERPSSCLLLYQSPLGRAASARLAIVRRSEDGFRIAEEDLRLRGPGEVLGLRQSGLPAFRFADLAHHADLLSVARELAERALTRDPGLGAPESERLRLLLHLFERHDAVRLLAAG